jgi:2'-5' RNA ligase
MPRLFVAVWPPDDVLEAIAGLDRPTVDGLRWTGREQWHVTLRFLGPVDDATPVVEALRAAGAGAREVDAVLGPAVDRFGRRILHVPVAGLGPLAAAVRRATAHLGRPPDDRPFRGHITLARSTSVDLRRLAGAAVQGRWTVSRMSLVESILSPAGARYSVLETFPLGPPAGPG